MLKNHFWSAFFAIVVYSPLYSYAQWEVSTQKLVYDFNQSLQMPWGPNNLNIYNVLWAFAEVKTLKQPTPAEKISLFLTPGHFAHPQNSSNFPLDIYLYRTPRKGPRPLMVFLPGVFMDESVELTVWAVERFISQGFDVVVIPNPLSWHYLKSFPVASPAMFEQEADVVLQVIAKAKETLLRSKSDEIWLSGASYGGHLALIAAAKDKGRLITGQVSALGAPLNMRRAIVHLDDMIDRYFKNQFATESVFAGLFHDGLRWLLHNMKWRYDLDKKFGFQSRKYLPGVETAFENVEPDSPDYKSMVRFNFIIHFFIEESKPYYTGPGNESTYWLQQAVKNGMPRVRILMAADDVLNDRDAVAKLPSEIVHDAEHFLVRKTGGHNGFIGTSWFDEFMKAAFPDTGK